jgi:hypothetical protein
MESAKFQGDRISMHLHWISCSLAALVRRRDWITLSPAELLEKLAAFTPRELLLT